MTDPVSDVTEARRIILGRELEGKDGVRDWRTSIRVERETGWTSGMPLREAKVFTWTDLSHISARPSEAHRNLTCHCSVSRCTRSMDPNTHPVRCASALEARTRIPLRPSAHHPGLSVYSPVDAFQIVAVLSVEPAMKYSPSGDHARSYTCFVVTLRRVSSGQESWGPAHWSIFCNRQCSLSGRSSEVSPKDTDGRSDGTHRMTFPSE